MSSDSEHERRSLEELLQESKRLREQARDIAEQMLILSQVIERKRNQTPCETDS